ncbi:cytochrome c biogenesis protein CcdA [Psychrobacter sp. I-STPA10]|uniref:cytochrome c biogenesis protein CcdA n=1 Tax=Psychrobacter sp. I-STPA10 TaxID=2585769 RepID=UPI001E5DDCD6|nr:protein-disulfide reductase DsbD domain-containing protein [Psychrobacter sp. I-STPA10]
MPLFFTIKRLPAFILSALLVISLAVLPFAHAAGLSDLFDSPAASSSNQGKILPVEQAFNVTTSTKANQLTIQMDITPGHYLYKDKLNLVLPKGVSASELNFNKTAHFVDDPDFGRVAVFDQPQVLATTTLTNSQPQAISNESMTLKWQGCAKAGLCYPPQTQQVALSLPAATQAKPNTETAKSKSAAKNTVTPPNNTNAPASSAPQLPSSRYAVSPPNLPNVSPAIPAIKPVSPPDSPSLTVAEANDSQANQNHSIALTGNEASSITGITGINPPAGEFSESISDAQMAAMADGVESGSTFDDTMLNSDALNQPDFASTQNDALPADQQVSIPAVVDETQTAISLETTPSGTLNNTDPFGLAAHPWAGLGLLFLAGLGLAFTACVYPMIPIVANIVAHQHNPTALKGILLTAGYALGVAVAYGILGAVIGFFGEALGITGWLQNPVILLSFAAIFILLGLYMLEAYNVRLPSKISHKLQNISQSADSKLGSFGGSFIAGLLSALVVSPCVSGPLVGALTAVATIGSPAYGFIALFVMGLGLTTPLLILGATQGNFMPKAGAWMVWVKQGFALLLFAVALLLIERVFVSALMLVAWGTWLMVVAMWLWSWQGRAQMFSRAFSIVAATWAIALIAGAAMGNHDNLRPLSSLNQTANTTGLNSPATNDGGNLAATNQKLQAIKVTNLAALSPIISSHNKVLVDVTADWCIECRIMDRTLFTNPPSELTDWQVVKLDITETNASSKEILAYYQLFGPPALLYYINGELKVQQVGETKRDIFEQTLQTL